MKPKILFLTLNVFSATGGIEKVCRAAGKALAEGADENSVSMHSLYDSADEVDERYFSKQVFKGYGGSRLRFVMSSLKAGRGVQTVLLSHINLLPVGYLIKRLSPSTRLVLLAHGIEVWEPISGWKGKLLQAVDVFLPVSKYTAEKLTAVHGIAGQRMAVLNNCLDPFLPALRSEDQVESLRKRYKILPNEQVLLTVTRLKHSEQYKGYDNVVKSLKQVAQHYPVRYLIVGKYDAEEKLRLDSLIAQEGVEAMVTFAGFAKEEELAAHFHMADAYVMPSTGEGFGIVFIEALHYGLPVIAGNRDGSVDALADGQFGKLINPLDVAAIATAIVDVLQQKEKFTPKHEDVVRQFGFATYRHRLRSLLGLSETGSQPLSKRKEAVA